MVNTTSRQQPRSEPQMDEVSKQLLHEQSRAKSPVVEMSSESHTSSSLPIGTHSTPVMLSTFVNFSQTGGSEPNQASSVQALVVICSFLHISSEDMIFCLQTSFIELCSFFKRARIATGSKWYIDVSRSLLGGKYSDLTVIDDETRWNAHKFVVCSQSCVLESMVTEEVSP
jgi:hypothetical protein